MKFKVKGISFSAGMGQIKLMPDGETDDALLRSVTVQGIFGGTFLDIEEGTIVDVDIVFVDGKRAGTKLI